MVIYWSIQFRSNWFFVKNSIYSIPQICESTNHWIWEHSQTNDKFDLQRQKHHSIHQWRWAESERTDYRWHHWKFHCRKSYIPLLQPISWYILQGQCTGDQKLWVLLYMALFDDILCIFVSCAVISFQCLLCTVNQLEGWKARSVLILIHRKMTFLFKTYFGMKLLQLVKNWSMYPQQ